MTDSCDAVTETGSLWKFCPSTGAAYLFICLFGIVGIVHLAQAIVHRKFYSTVIIVSALLQFATYILRIISINNPSSVNAYAGWFVLILVAPIWTNAYVYMVFGRMVYNFLPSQRLWKTKPWMFGMYFVALDVIAFIIQVIGASRASGGGQSDGDSSQTGLYIYMGGVGIQQFFILIFISCAVRFQLRMAHESTPDQKARGMRLLYVLYAVLFLITVRIIFRLIEYSNGVNSSIADNEVYMYVFDTAPMFIAILLFNIFHPGRIMPGKQSEWPGRKERKRLGEKQNLITDSSERLGPDGALPPQYEMV